MSATPQLFVIMGVSGSGKTTIGQLLAHRLGTEFLDADDFHPQVNKDKMRAGIPLTDDDRWPWLQILNTLLQQHKDNGCVLACSALRQAYRDVLLRGIAPEQLDFVLLDGSKQMIAERMTHRHHEFMNIGLLDSQFATLEEPKNALKVRNDRQADAVVDEILQRERISPTEGK